MTKLKIPLMTNWKFLSVIQLKIPISKPVQSWKTRLKILFCDWKKNSLQDLFSWKFRNKLKIMLRDQVGNSFLWQNKKPFLWPSWKLLSETKLKIFSEHWTTKNSFLWTMKILLWDQVENYSPWTIKNSCQRASDDSCHVSDQLRIPVSNQGEIPCSEQAENYSPRPSQKFFQCTSWKSFSNAMSKNPLRVTNQKIL